ncbi:MAG: tetratricopeptide repeat protein [Chlamydiae bacterium]|nr:tetratricopeptide repeat protein [Chlamydiota bacterium]
MISPISHTSIEQLELYRRIFIREIFQEFKFVDDIIAGRSDARTDLTDKIIHVLTTTVTTTVGLGITTIASPIVQGVISTAAQKGEEFISDKRKEKSLQHLSQLFAEAGKKQLQTLIKEVAKKAMERYEVSICILKKEEVPKFARLGVRRIFEYLGRTKKSLELDNLLTGLIEGKSGKGIDKLKNTRLKCKTNLKFYGEGAYSRGAFYASDGKIWLAPKVKGRNFGYAKLVDKKPKYFIRIPEAIVRNYWQTPHPASGIDAPPFVRKICSLKDVEDYLQSPKKESFNDYLKNIYPGTEMGVFCGDLSDFNLRGKDFSGSDLSGSKISGSLKNTNFSGCDLSSAIFKNISSADGAIFIQADLTKVQLTGDFRNANFNQADLTLANCEGNFTSIQYIGTIWAGANIEKMKVDSREHLLTIQQRQFDNQFTTELTTALAEQKKKFEELEAKITSKKNNNNDALSLQIEQLKQSLNNDEILIHRYEKEIFSSNEKAILADLESIKNNLKNTYDILLKKIETFSLNQQNIPESAMQALAIAQNPLEKLNENLILQKIKTKNLSQQELKLIPLEKFITAIAQEPNNSFLCTNLAGVMEILGKEKVTLPLGEELTARQLYLKAISLNPNQATAYLNLGTILTKKEVIQLLDGTMMTKQQLYIKAISLDPTNSTAYYNLGTTLLNGESIQLLDETIMTKKQLYIEAIHFDPNNSKIYNNLGNTLANGEAIWLSGSTKMSKQQLYLKAIDLDPNNSKFYSNLGKTLEDNETVELLDGTKMTKPQLFLKAISLDPKNFKAYDYLEAAFPEEGTLQLLDGTKITKKQFNYLKAIGLNPNDSMVFNNLGTTVRGKSIKLLDGTMMTEQQLYLKAIELDSNDSIAFHNLGTTLEDWEKVQLPDGTKMTKRELYLKAISLNPFPLAYYNLATTLSELESIELPNDTKMNQQELLLKVIELDPKFSMAYSGLGINLRKRKIESIQLPNGTKMTQQELFLKAIELDPNDSMGYKGLGIILPLGVSIQLPDGTKMTKPQLLIKAIDLEQVLRLKRINELYSIVFPNEKKTF